MPRLMLILSLAAAPAHADPTPDQPPPADPPRFAISGRVTGCSGKHAVFVALHDPGMFQAGHGPVAELVRRPDEVRDGVVAFTFTGTAGAYAVSAFEDENANGELDMGWFGPTEPSQFYRRFTAWRAPRFEDVAFTVDRDITDAVIALR